MPTEFVHKDFYVAITAILPILFLAISIQSSSFIESSGQNQTPGAYKFMHASLAIFMLGLLTFFEGVALYALYNSKEGRVNLLMLGFVMVLAVLYIALDFVLKLYKKSQDFGLYVFFMFLGIAILFIQLKDIVFK